MTNRVYTTDTSINLGDCFLWQYDLANRLKSLMQAKQKFYKQSVSDFWLNWTTNVFNINTANTFGLSLWGSLLGITRPSYEDNGQLVPFTDEQYRTLIKGRLLLMNSNGSIKDLNAYLNFLFPSKPVFVVDYGNMHISLIFYYQPTNQELAIILSDGFLPRPVGVKIDWIIVPPDQTFGYYGQELSTFDNGTFLA